MTRRLSLALAGLAALALALFVALACARAPYPYELEWEEGGVLQHVQRVLAGKPLYAEPSLGFIAFPYTPLFYWLGALSVRLCGESFLALRLVSIVATLVCFVVIGRIAARHARSPWAGVFAAGLFAASYRVSGAWFDVARVDALFLALSLAAIDVLDRRAGARAAFAGAGFFFLAFLAKQSALVPALAALVALAFRNRREALAFALTLAVLVAASTLALDAQSDGWYRWYVFRLLAGHPWNGAMVLGFWREMALALAPTALLVLFTLRREAVAGARFIALAVAGLWLCAWISRAHVGGYENTLMPAFAGAALFFGPAATRALEGGRKAALLGALAGVLQFGLLAYDPRPLVPRVADRAAGDAIVERLRAIQGEVWMPDHGYLAVRAGKSESAHGMAVIDLLQSREHDVAQRFVDALSDALIRRGFAAIVLDQRWDAILPPLAASYAANEARYEDARAFVPATGDPRRPLYWYAPR